MTPSITTRDVVLEERQHVSRPRRRHSADCVDVAYANCYITKPVDFEQFAHVVRAIDQFWFTVVTLPTDDNGGEQNK